MIRTGPEGLVRVSDLRGLGLTPEERAESVMDLLRVRRGAYAPELPDGDVQSHLLVLRAVLADRPDAVASHVSAALIHGLPVETRDLLKVHVSLVRGKSRGGFRHGVHTHNRRISPAALNYLDGLWVSDAATTVVDCARSLPLSAALAIADAAVHQQLTTEDDLRQLLDDYRRTKGVPSARRVIDLIDPQAESPGESRTRLILVEAGFKVRSQVELRDEQGRFVARSDMLIEGTPVVVEFDGRAKFSMTGDIEAAHWAAKMRRDRIEEQGLVVFVVVWPDLSRPRLLIQRLETVLRRLGLDPGKLRAS